MTEADQPRQLIETDPYAAHLGIRLADGPDLAVEMTIEEHHLNFLGGLHGGALFSLADCALSIASNLRSKAVAIDTHMVLTGRANVGEVIRAHVEEITRGQRLGTYRIEITRPNERVIALFTGTVMLV